MSATWADLIAIGILTLGALGARHVAGRKRLSRREGFPATIPMRQRPRTPGDLHWGDELPAAVVTALHNEARAITAAAAHSTDQKAT